MFFHVAQKCLLNIYQKPAQERAREGDNDDTYLNVEEECEDEMKLKTIYRESETVLSFFLFYGILLSLFFFCFIFYSQTLFLPSLGFKFVWIQQQREHLRITFSLQQSWVCRVGRGKIQSSSRVDSRWYLFSSSFWALPCNSLSSGLNVERARPELPIELWTIRSKEQWTKRKKVYRWIESTFEHERVISMLIEN